MCIYALRQTFEKATITINKGKMAAVFKTCSPSQGAVEMSELLGKILNSEDAVGTLFSQTFALSYGLFAVQSILTKISSKSNISMTTRMVGASI